MIAALWNQFMSAMGQITQIVSFDESAFICSNVQISNEMAEWSEQRDNGHATCTDDLDALQFAHILAGMAWSHYLDKCADAAVVGTEDAQTGN